MLGTQLKGTPKQTHRYYLGGLKQRYIYISSEFDSGNLGDVKQISDFSYRITPASDCAGSPYEANTRGWFYFSVKGFPPNTRGRFLVNRANILWSFVNNKIGLAYYPCYNNTPSDVKGWRKLQEPGQIYQNNNQQVELQFDYLFKNQEEEVRFAITYPYEYSRCLSWMNTLMKQYKNDDDIYLQQQVLTKSLQQRDVHLLTVMERKIVGLCKEKQQRPEGLFPIAQAERPPKDKKPVVLISARVHAGQSPSNFALQGMMNFLLNKEDLRSQLLLKLFTFKIVPMLNPDGVYNGHYRMDTYGQNLNRYYTNCNPNKQPSIFALKTLMEYYSKQNRLLFYFDLHAHPARKGCFVYGNALSDFVQQVENYVFCRLISLNTKYFEYQCCNFSKKHMKLKDRYEQLSKEGCGRVFAYKCAGIIHSFTLELGYHFTNNTHSIGDASNTSFKLNQTGYKPLLDCSNDSAYLTPKAYQNVGESLLISILDSIQKNPYSRVVTSEYCTLQNLRRLIAFQVFHEDQRFRMFEAHTYTKVKHINQLIEQSFYSKQAKSLQLSSEIEWPDCVRVGKQSIGSPQHLQYARQNSSPSPQRHNSSLTERIQLPQIGKSSPIKFKVRSCSVKKQDSQREDQQQEELELAGSEQSSGQEEGVQQKTQPTEYQQTINTPGGSPEHSRIRKAQLKLINLKLALENPLQGIFKISQNSFTDNQSSNNFNSGSNRAIRQINLTFQQNFIVFPAVGGNSKSKQPTTAQSQTSKSQIIDKMILDEESQGQRTAMETMGERKSISAAQQQLKDQLLKEMQYFKREIKQQFSKDIKKEVSEQINKNGFVRGYLKNKRNLDIARSRRNKFFPSGQQILSVSSIKPEDRQKILKLPSISK